MSSTTPRRRRPAPVGSAPTVGQLAAGRRLALGLTQADLADLAGVGISSVRSLEADQVTLTLAVVIAILDALGLALAAGPRPILQTSPELAVLSPAAVRDAGT